MFSTGPQLYDLEAWRLEKLKAIASYWSLQFSSHCTDVRQ